MNHQRWLSAAISDDKLVADLLLRLKDSSTSTTTTTTSTSISPPHFYITSLPPTWGLRHPRSSSLYNNKRNNHRRSPTTPLSCASLSDGGSDDCSGHSSDLFRSKISTSTETPSTFTERCKRIKLDLHQESRLKSEANFTEPEEQTTNQSGAASSEAGSTSLYCDSGLTKNGILTSELHSGFVLPDLNMMPDEDCGEDCIVGITS